MTLLAGLQSRVRQRTIEQHVDEFCNDVGSDNDETDGFDDAGDEGDDVQEQSVELTDDEEDDGPPTLMPYSQWSLLDAEEMFDGIIDNARWDDNVDDDLDGTWDDAVYGVCDEEPEDLFDEIYDDAVSRRDRLLSSHGRVDRSRTHCWSLRDETHFTESYRCRFALSADSVEAATRFKCPCGGYSGGSYCAERIGLRRETVIRERGQTFAASARGRMRLRLHAIRLMPNIQDPRALTSIRFHPTQRKSRYHFFAQGSQPICRETYAEMCGLGETCLREICKLADAAYEDNLDLTDDSAWSTLCGSNSNVRTQEAEQRESDLVEYLDGLARSCSEAIPDGETVNSLSVAAPDGSETCDVDDGGVEWRLPFREYKLIWRLYSLAVYNPYSYAQFIMKWWLKSRHIKRAGKAKDGFCQCDICLRLKRRLLLTTITQLERDSLHEQSAAHNNFQMSNRHRYSHHITKAEHALRDARARDTARLADAARVALMESLYPAATADGAEDGPRARSAASQLPSVPETVSIVCDCASSQKQGTLPSFGARAPKRYGTAQKLECKAMGCQIHGIWSAMLLFPGSVPHGANMTVETLDIALQKLNDMYGCLPPVVYIQLDNCSDNKSKTVLSYLYDLRRRGLLSKVTTCMLIVGHTHIDIDQWFGVFSRALTREEALGFPAYSRVLKSAFALERNAPDEVKFVERVHDWDKYYCDAIDPRFARFGMTTASGEATRCFKLKGNAAGEGRLFYKDFMVSRETKPRPLQINDLWQPTSAEEAESVFGSLWTEASTRYAYVSQVPTLQHYQQ